MEVSNKSPYNKQIVIVSEMSLLKYNLAKKNQN